MRNERKCYCCNALFVGNQGQRYCNACRYMTIEQRKRKFPKYKPIVRGLNTDQSIVRVLESATTEQLIRELSSRNIDVEGGVVHDG